MFRVMFFYMTLTCFYSQHAQTEDPRHRVTVAEQVAPIPAVLGQPPLPLFFANGSMVDIQFFHDNSLTDERSVLLSSSTSRVSSPPSA